jgi:hypothetical protein
LRLVVARTVVRWRLDGSWECHQAIESQAAGNARGRRQATTNPECFTPSYVPIRTR